MKILFFGDSIFYNGFEETPGFLTMLTQSLSHHEAIQLEHASIGGNKVYDLLIRFDTDVPKYTPDIIIINTGTNDVNHKYSRQTGTDEEKYQKYLNMLLEKIKSITPHVIVCNIAVAGENVSDTGTRNTQVDEYCQFIKNISTQQNVTLCDVRTAFKEFLLENNPDHLENGILTPDGIHFNQVGYDLYTATLLAELEPMIKRIR